MASTANKPSNNTPPGARRTSTQNSAFSTGFWGTNDMVHVTKHEACHREKAPPAWRSLAEARREARVPLRQSPRGERASTAQLAPSHRDTHALLLHWRGRRTLPRTGRDSRPPPARRSMSGGRLRR